MLWWTLRKLRSSDPEARARAAAELGALRKTSAVPALISRIGDQDPAARLAVIEALGAIGHPASAGPLASALAAHGAPGEALAKALAAVGRPAVGPLSGLLQSARQETRRWAATALGMIRDPGPVGGLSGLLEDSRSEVRRAAACALGAIGDPGAVEPLLKALSSRDMETRRAAAEALSHFPGAGTEDALIRAVTDPQEPVQLAAVHALSVSGGLKAAACLRSVIGGPRKSVGDAAEAALKSMRFSPADARQRAELAVLRGHFEAAAGEGDVAVGALARALEFRDPRMRRRAAETLGAAGAAEAAGALAKALGDADPAVAEASMRALVRIGSPSEPGLRQALGSYNASVARLAATALGEIADPASAADLLDFVENTRLSSDYPDMFDAVAAALRALERIVSISAAKLSDDDLGRAAGLPERIDPPGKAAGFADCSRIRGAASAELLRRSGPA